MIYQTDPEFPPDIQHFGCYFLSLCFHLDRIFSLGIMTHEKVIGIYNAEESDSDLGNESFIQNPQGLVDHISNSRVHYSGFALAGYDCKPGEFEIQCWYNPITDFHHFVAALNGSVIYDPIEGGSRTVREGHLESKRIYLVAGES